MPTLYSHSRLSTFERCPKQFHFRYVEKRPIETESIEAFLGKRVHEILERLYRFVDRGMIPSLAKVLARFRAEWDAHFDADRVRIVRQENPASSYVETGERCLSNFYRSHYPFDRDETLGLEETVRFSLDPDGRYAMQGIVDRIARAADGAVEIQDYKTGRYVPSQSALDADRQLALYQIGLAATRFPGTPVRLAWYFLQRGSVATSQRSAEQLEALRAQTIERIDEIESATQFPPRPSALCAWCEFVDVCPAQSEAKAVATAAPPLPNRADASPMRALSPAPPEASPPASQRPAATPREPRAPAPTVGQMRLLE